MKATVLLIGLLVLIIAISGCITETIETEPNQCLTDSDCEIFWTEYSTENPCSGCSWEDERYICMNKVVAESEMRRLEAEGMIAMCSPCPNPDYSYTCICDNKCIKTKIVD